MKSSAFIYEESHLDACSVVQLRKYRKVDFVHLALFSVGVMFCHSFESLPYSGGTAGLIDLRNKHSH